MAHTQAAAFPVSRRHLLGGIAAGAATAILAACGGSGGTATSTPAAGGSPTATTAGARAAAGSAITVTAPPTAPAAGTAAIGSVASGTKAASSGATGTIAPPQPGQFAGKTLTMLSRQEYFKTVDTAFDTAIGDFAKITGCTIDNTHTNLETNAVVAKQDAAVKAGNVQDMAYFVGFISQLHQLGDILPVTDVVQELEAAYGPAEDEIKIALFIDGEWWGIPFYSNSGGWFMRRDWLAEKGIKPEEIKTFEQARDAALAISDPSKNRYGWGNTMNDGDGNAVMSDVFHAYGSSIASDDGTKVAFNSPETVAAVSFLADIYTNPKYKDMIPPGVQSWTPTGNNEAWLANTIGITQNQFTLYAQSKATNNPVYGQTAPVAGFLGPGTDQVINIGGWGAFVIFKGAKQPELAKAAAKYMVAGAPLKSMVTLSTGVIMPGYKNLWDTDPFYTTGDPIFPTIRGIVEESLPIATKSGFHFPQTPSAGNDQVVNTFVLSDMMSDVIFKGVKPADAVKSATDRMVQAFNQVGLKQ